MYPYFHAPLFLDVSLVAEEAPPTLSDVPVQEYNLLAQLLSVIPPASKNLVPVEIRFLYEDNSPLMPMFPQEFIIERDGYNTDWQGIVLVPPVDIREVIEVIKNTTEGQRIRYQSVESLVYTTNPEVQKNLKSKVYLRK